MTVSTNANISVRVSLFANVDRKWFHLSIYVGRYRLKIATLLFQVSFPASANRWPHHLQFTFFCFVSIESAIIKIKCTGLACYDLCFLSSLRQRDSQCTVELQIIIFHKKGWIVKKLQGMVFDSTLVVVVINVNVVNVRRFAPFSGENLEDVETVNFQKKSWTWTVVIRRQFDVNYLKAKLKRHS